MVKCNSYKKWKAFCRQAAKSRGVRIVFLKFLKPQEVHMLFLIFLVCQIEMLFADGEWFNIGFFTEYRLEEYIKG